MRQSIEKQLETDKQVLWEKIKDSAAGLSKSFVEMYPEYMLEYVDSAVETFSSETLREQEILFTREQEDIMDYVGKSNDLRKSGESIIGNLKTNVSNLIKDKNYASAIKNIAGNLQSDIENARGYWETKNTTRHKIDKEAADRLLEYVSYTFKTRLAEKCELLEQKSQEYWTSKTENLRRQLAIIVTGADELTEERRNELENIIITYQKISFKENDADNIFDKGNFERSIKLGEQILWQSDHLNIEKLSRTYNINIIQGVQTRYKSVEESHKDSADIWIQNLTDEIYANIVEFNPDLSKQAKNIRYITTNIKEIEERKEKLDMYTRQLRAMMDWKLQE